MCGLVGVAGGSPGERETDSVGRMVASLTRRGPDGSGVHRFRNCVLGHARLAIFDLSPAGHQPMVLEDGRVGVVLNGAIYNFVELRTVLEREGARFRSRSDTEVLLWGYRAWGLPALVRRLRGMFAFALYDDARDSLWLVRDRLGVKPLIYTQRGAQLAFASTVAALRAGRWADTLNAHAVASFLEHGFIPESESIYTEVRKVPPASIVEFTAGRLTSTTYWTPPAATRASTFEDAVEETERLLLTATERRLRADVPVAALLSGGIDSALICSCARRLGADLPVFTVSASGEPEDESLDAKATAARLGLRHRVLPMDRLGFEDIDTLVAAYGEPFACSSALGMLQLSRAVAAEGIKVLLTGEGGDDAFLGYQRHVAFARAQSVARYIPAAAGTAWRFLRPALPDRGASRRLKHRIDIATGGLGAVLSTPDGFPAFRTRGLLGPRLLDLSIDARTLPWSVAAARRVLTDYIDYDRGAQFVGEYMTKVDGSTMYFGLEARAPFLDQTLWEYAASLPTALRLRSGATKAVLRAIARRRLGERVASAPKRGFSVPVRTWMAGRWAARALEILEESSLARDGWLEPSRLRSEFELARRYRPAATRLWYLLVLELWMRRQ